MEQELMEACVAEVYRDQYRILAGDEIMTAVLKGSMLLMEAYPVVGDRVHCIPNPYGDALITDILPRRTVLKRPDMAGHEEGYAKAVSDQIMVANFDEVWITTSLNENYNINRIARYVSVTLAGGGIPVAVLTKADLCEDVQEKVREVQALSDRVQVLPVSCVTGEGLTALRQRMVGQSTIVLMGSSGAGKSTLINTLCGREVMKTSAIREKDGKGRHTTTARTMIRLPEGVTLIDTPGMREIGVSEAGTGISSTFSDIEELILQCRFQDCRHGNEKGCAVQAAIRAGTLAEKRWQLYSQLQQENNRHADMKAIAKHRKMLNRQQDRRGY